MEFFLNQLICGGDCCSFCSSSCSSSIPGSVRIPAQSDRELRGPAQVVAGESGRVGLGILIVGGD